MTFAASRFLPLPLPLYFPPPQAAFRVGAVALTCPSRTEPRATFRVDSCVSLQPQPIRA